MKVLITGGGGFVGSHLVNELRSGIAAGVDIAVTSKDHCDFPWADVTALDVMDGKAVRSLIAAYRPTHVIHLAGVAAPKVAQANPEGAWKLHVRGALNVADAILDLDPSCTFIHIGSGMVYGESAKSGLPLDETALLAPIDDYAVTKAAGDLAVGALAHRGLKVLRMRPFNHAGPGQSEAFVISAFAAQVAKIEAGKAPPLIRVGNLESERDFLDVRDVVRSYLLAVEKSDSLRDNPIFNIASGIPRRIGDILEWFLKQSRVKIAVEQAADRTRAGDLPRIVGNAKRAHDVLDWRPRYTFEETLRSVLEHFRERTLSLP